MFSWDLGGLHPAIPDLRPANVLHSVLGWIHQFDFLLFQSWKAGVGVILELAALGCFCHCGVVGTERRWTGLGSAPGVPFLAVSQHLLPLCSQLQQYSKLDQLWGLPEGLPPLSLS